MRNEIKTMIKNKLRAIKIQFDFKDREKQARLTDFKDQIPRREQSKSSGNQAHRRVHCGQCTLPCVICSIPLGRVEVLDAIHWR